jgi:hypothetical protein
MLLNELVLVHELVIKCVGTWNECEGTWNEGSFHMIDNWIILKKLAFKMNIFFYHIPISS